MEYREEQRANRDRADVDIAPSVSASSTDSEVPSAKCLYDLGGNITAQIDAM